MGAAGERPGLRNRAWNAIVAVWAALVGIAPHVLHHVGPLAGTALVAGAGGQALFGAVGFVATIPMLIKLRRRFSTWLAPALGLVLFVSVFSLSTFVIGPRISGADDAGSPTGASTGATPHDLHHDATTDPGSEAP